MARDSPIELAFAVFVFFIIGLAAVKNGDVYLGLGALLAAALLSATLLKGKR